MGGGYYHSDVSAARSSIGTTRSSERAFDYSQRADLGQVRGVHPDLNIFGKIRECCDSQDHPASTPVAVLMDVTSSRGDDALAIYSQVPSFLGSIAVTGAVPDPAVMWVAIGDANSDRAPLQISQFESDQRIDAQLRQIWMEKGGGGTGQESYELAAYALARKTKLDCIKRGAKGFAFFLGDESPYPIVSPSLVKSVFGDDLKREIGTKKIFAEMQKLYHPFFIFPRTSMQQRKTAIDSEIRQRLVKAGGRFKDVEIRATLIWNDRTDLDLHCLTPGGEHIFFANKRVRCGGELDVDRNVHGEDPKPVENIRWAKGDAVRGRYKFWVNLYGYHQPYSGTIPFKVEIDINGQIETIGGKVNGVGQDCVVKEFTYVPPAERAATDDHAAYQDEQILGEWSKYIPEANILRVEDPANSVEVMLGVLALQSGSMDLAAFMNSMKDRKVATARRDDVHSALQAFARQCVVTEVGDLF